MAEGKDWTYDEDAQSRVRIELEAVDIMHSGFPKCALCGQRAERLDRFGLCSKTSEPHRDWRAGIRADTKAGAR